MHKSTDLKHKWKLAKYQVGLFQREYNRIKKRYDAWEAKQQTRAEEVGLKYFDYDELYSDYIIGKIDEETFKYQRQWYFAISADTWLRRDKLAWLEKNIKAYTARADALEDLYRTEVRNRDKERRDKAYRKIYGRKKMYYDPTKNISKYNQPKIERNKEKFGKRRAEKAKGESHES